ncbi:MAG: prepilin-type N-terminal cleavage/methylation domain-containing protein [Candidatus Doudnabacteria bacterium]|nr:prepilin-type N-terminal cleavage/methylation domain-containing protein [bacterium]MDZ4243886.1 prepilin-type N-terminal cleavage/methylation domain-containing protein [Candidatus Doudnabacteria bacterium]
MKIKNCKIENLQGFTLIEAVVATSLFAIAMTSIVGIYLSVQRLNQTSAAMQALQQNGRFILEDLTKTIRNGQIDYARYPSQTVPQPYTGELYLIDNDGSFIRIFRQGDELRIDKGGGVTSAFSGREVKVLDFRVYIWPSRNPFGGGGAQEQPTATVFLNLQANIGPRITTRIPFQTTVATRQYPE